MKKAGRARFSHAMGIGEYARVPNAGQEARLTKRTRQPIPTRPSEPPSECERQPNNENQGTDKPKGRCPSELLEGDPARNSRRVKDARGK